MVTAKGPVFEGNIEEFAVTEGGETYRFLYLPDKNNPELQQAGQPPHYYWMPKSMRIATDGQGRKKFSLLRFLGIQGSDTTVGVEEDQEIAGGTLSLTVTGEPPAGILEKAHEKLRQKYRGKNDRYWGWRVSAAPQFGVVPISSNVTTLSNLSPDEEGNAPALGGGGERSMEMERGGRPRPAAESGSGSGRPGGSDSSGPGGPPGSSGGTGGSASAGGPGQPGSSGTSGSPGSTGGGGSPGSIAEGDITGPDVPVRSLVEMPQTIPQRDMTNGQRSNLDAWYARLDGEGMGSLDPAGENAFSAMLGSLPTAILWQGFHGAYSPISVTNAMKVKVWSENIHLKMTGDWKSIYEHFSAHAQGKAWWFSADIKAELNRMIKQGTIKVELSIDGTQPGADKYEEALNKRMDMIRDEFMKVAKDVIFKEPEKESAAEAPKTSHSFFKPYGLGLALKARRDVTEVELTYEESINRRYNMDHVISTTLEGFYDDIKDDPEAERRYFQTLYLDEWNRKVHRVAKPVVRWEDKAENWIGEPVAFLSAQFGYPTTRGDIMWKGNVFDKGNQDSWTADFSMKPEADVNNPPSGWEPDKTFMKRRIHFEEPPGANEYPHSQIQIEQNTVELDPGENGRPTNDIIHEVRADMIGKLEVGPMYLDAVLEGANQYVEVAMKALGTKENGEERDWVRFTWRANDQDEPRIWEVFTGQEEFKQVFKYQVKVVVKGTIFSSGMEWVGPEEEVAGSGPLMIHVPTMDEAEHTRSMTAMEAATPGPVVAGEGVPPERGVAEPTEAAGTKASEAAREYEAPPSGRPGVSQLLEEPGSEYGEERSGEGIEREAPSGKTSTFSKVHGWKIE